MSIINISRYIDSVLNKMARPTKVGYQNYLTKFDPLKIVISVINMFCCMFTKKQPKQVVKPKVNCRSQQNKFRKPRVKKNRCLYLPPLSSKLEIDLIKQAIEERLIQIKKRTLDKSEISVRSREMYGNGYSDSDILNENRVTASKHLTNGRDLMRSLSMMSISSRKSVELNRYNIAPNGTFYEYEANEINGRSMD
ncbi:hypothetical protein GJ496_004587 [Pomphorhynchus laevis]|nr:hypothetical protein GJ496_004587 [Pomphorhynchus laevis]